MNLKLLEKEFTGIGEVKGKRFKQVYADDLTYIYMVAGKNYYEVFKRLKTPICIDFASRTFSKTDFKEKYPKSKDFGVWAWTFVKYENALKKITELKNLENEKE